MAAWLWQYFKVLFCLQGGPLRIFHVFTFINSTWKKAWTLLTLREPATSKFSVEYNIYMIWSITKGALSVVCWNPSNSFPDVYFPRKKTCVYGNMWHKMVQIPHWSGVSNDHFPTALSTQIGLGVYWSKELWKFRTAWSATIKRFEWHLSTCRVRLIMPAWHTDPWNVFNRDTHSWEHYKNWTSLKTSKFIMIIIISTRRLCHILTFPQFIFFYSSLILTLLSRLAYLNHYFDTRKIRLMCENSRQSSPIAQSLTQRALYVVFC